MECEASDPCGPYPRAFLERNVEARKWIDRSDGAGVVEPTLSFEEVFVAEFPAVERTVFLIVHDREMAKEVTQEAFVALLRSWWKVSRYQRPGAWVRRVAIHLAVRAARRDESRARAELRAAEPQDWADARDLDVLRAVRCLPARQRAAVVLFYFEDRSVEDVADLLSCSPQTARVHLHRGRQRLGKLLSLEEVDR
jgi:RNA polymerase sigma factor (sigma-70 family)